MSILIRPATTADVQLLQQLSITTFTDTYAIYNTAENMQLFIDTHYNTGQLLKELADTNMQYYLAFVGDEPAGYIKLRTTENPPELAGKKHIEVERIYVLPALKGGGIGRQMIEHTLNTAKEQGYDTIWLGVWEQNTKAQAFYTKMGFTVFGEHLFVLGTDEQRDWLMMKAV